MDIVQAEKNGCTQDTKMLFCTTDRANLQKQWPELKRYAI